MLEGFRFLVQGLMKSSLQYLNVRGNAIRNEGVAVLAEYLGHSDFRCRNHLEELDISLNEVSQKGLTALAEVLPETRIKTLNLAKNYLD
jgi:Ran GTPase-activating protein (RanGAP) involved in mRNA processing and transport